MTDVDLTTPSPPSPTPSWTRRVLVGIGGFAFWPFFFVMFSGTPACMGFEEPTLAALEACPDVATALGTPIRRSWVGMSCGNAETEGDFGQASWSFPVEGPNGRGTVDVVAEQRGGPWQIYSATVETSTGTFEAVACGRGAGAALGGAPGITAQHVTATVSTAMGAAPAAMGATCEIDVGPGAGPFPCRAVITCNGTTVYGGGTSGYLTCMPDATGHLIVMDAEQSASSGDPQLTLTLASGSGVMSDSSAGGTWMMTFAFPPPP